MTKINTTNTFDIGQIPDVKGIEPLVNFVNEMALNYGKCLRNGVGLSDNLDVEIKKYECKSNVTLVIKNKKIPIGIIILQQASTIANVTSFKWQIDSQADVNITVLFDNPTFSTMVSFLFIYS